MAGTVFRANRAGMARLLDDRRGPVVLHIANLGREVRGEAKKLVPVVSGKLKDSIDFDLVRTSRGWAAEVHADQPYASWIEDGKRYDPRSGKKIYVKVGPRPFLRDALNSLRLSRSTRLP